MSGVFVFYLVYIFFGGYLRGFGNINMKVSTSLECMIMLNYMDYRYQNSVHPITP